MWTPTCKAGVRIAQTNMDEIWKDVVGYEGLYQISNLGRVKSLYGTGGKPYCEHCGRGHKNLTDPTKPRIKKFWTCPERPYPTVRLSKNKKTKNYSVHRLVACAFLPPVPGRPHVNHKDGNKLNMQLSNLEWTNYRENFLHAVEYGLVILDKNGYSVPRSHLNT